MGPVSAEAVYDIMASGSAFLKGIVTKGKDVVGVVHYGRRPNAHQQSALEWLFPTCAAEGCGTAAAYCETDHRLEWAKSHVTLLGLLDRLCRYHHRLKTYQGWALAEGRGKRPFVPPDDPRHPRHRAGGGREVPGQVPIDEVGAHPAPHGAVVAVDEPVGQGGPGCPSSSPP